MKYQNRAEIRKGRRDRLAYTGWQAGASVVMEQPGGPQPQLHTVTAPSWELGSACLTVQPGGKDSTGIKMEGNTLEMELKQKREEKRSVKENTCYVFLFMPFDDSCEWMDTVCPWHKAQHHPGEEGASLPKLRCSFPVPSAAPRNSSGS